MVGPHTGKGVGAFWFLGAGGDEPADESDQGVQLRIRDFGEQRTGGFSLPVGGADRDAGLFENGEGVQA